MGTEEYDKTYGDSRKSRENGKIQPRTAGNAQRETEGRKDGRTIKKKSYKNDRQRTPPTLDSLMSISPGAADAGQVDS